MGKLLESTPAEVTATAHAASGVAGDWARSGADVRAKLLRGLAEALEAHRNDLVALADRETSLGIARLSGEIDRTAFQLRGFASIVEQGAPFSVVDDEAVVAAPPVGRPRLTRVRVPLGPVAMFSASNFPFAFSVLGGDTASALAAGCPVVVKAHPGHPAVSRAVHSLATQVLEAQGLSPDLIGMVEGASTDVGVSLVREPMIAAVAFTGSYQGGRALEQVTQTRPRPIPFFGELGSVNPVIATPSLLAERGAELAKSLAASITLGCGQFCTSPGLIVLESDVTSDTFVADLGTALEALKPHAMLSPQIRGGFDTGVARWRNHGKAKVLVGPAADAGAAPLPFLAQVRAADFISDPSLHEEVFGPAALIVRSSGIDETINVLEAIGGSLTVTLWGIDKPDEASQRLVQAASKVAGRVLFSGVPTGVAITAAQQHGGPFPSSTQPMTTSVGYAALDRFLRPVALQDAPAWLIERKGVPC